MRFDDHTMTKFEIDINDMTCTYFNRKPNIWILFIIITKVAMNNLIILKIDSIFYNLITIRRKPRNFLWFYHMEKAFKKIFKNIQKALFHELKNKIHWNTNIVSQLALVINIPISKKSNRFLTFGFKAWTQNV